MPSAVLRALRDVPKSPVLSGVPQGEYSTGLQQDVHPHTTHTFLRL